MLQFILTILIFWVLTISAEAQSNTNINKVNKKTQSPKACIKDALGETAFSAKNRVGNAKETDQELVRAFFTQTGHPSLITDLREACTFLESEEGENALNFAKFRIYPAAIPVTESGNAGGGESDSPPPVAPFVSKTNFGSFIFEPITSVKLSSEHRRFGFELRSLRGEYLSTVNIYAPLAELGEVVVFLISADQEKISTAEATFQEFAQMQLKDGKHQILTVSKNSPTCGKEVEIFSKRVDRARFKIAIKALFDLLIEDQLDLPKKESEGLMELISYCFFQRI